MLLDRLRRIVTRGPVNMRGLLPCLLPILCLALAACGSTPGGGYVGGSVPLECAPFARALTKVQLSGAAADWWSQADGHYTRARTPAVGSVMVFRISGRLPNGHVAVVSKLLSQREILVTQANWVHHRVTQDQPVVDISGAGDWSMVRVWWPPSAELGVTGYRVFGFIRPDHPSSRAALVGNIPAAIKTARAGW